MDRPQIGRRRIGRRYLCPIMLLLAIAPAAPAEEASLTLDAIGTEDLVLGVRGFVKVLESKVSHESAKTNGVTPFGEVPLYVILRDRLWNRNQELLVCMYDGTEVAGKWIDETIATWQPYVQLNIRAHRVVDG